MPLVSVPAIYDGEQIKLLEPAPVKDRYRVLVTFVEPEADENPLVKSPRTLVDLKGIWHGVSLSFDEIKAAEYDLPGDLA